MSNNKNHNLDKKIRTMDDQLSDFLHIKNKINPLTATIKIILIYLITGGLWILFSDTLLFNITPQESLPRMLQTYKGWFYVLITGTIFFSIIYKNFVRYRKAIDKIYEGYEELTTLNEEVIALDEELLAQNKELRESREALIESEKEQEYMAYYDGLTGLPNRFKFENEVDNLIIWAQKNNEKLAMLYLDIDNFKNINDTLGHRAGDKLLQYFSGVLNEFIKEPNVIARLGGDEFAILLTEAEDMDYIRGIAKKLLDYFRKPWVTETTEFYISVSIGAAIYPDHGLDCSTLMQNADTAMYQAKSTGKDNYALFTSDMHKKALDYINLTTDLRRAIKNDEFMLYYQPKFEAGSERMVGVEALIRWNHPVNGIVMPNSFIPFTEKTGFINSIWQWVLRAACKQIREWKDKGYRDVILSVNVTGNMISDCGFFETCQSIIEEYNVEGNDIEFEITETVVMENISKAIDVLQLLKGIGVTIALDDFGSGYSSLTYLKKLPIDIVKIDKDFIINIVNEKDTASIFKFIIELSHSMGLKVVAEGVETEEQLDYARRFNCDIIQGFYYSQAIPACDIEKLYLGV